MPQVPRHKTFISYHHKNDQKYADMLRDALAADIVDKSVHDEDIDDRNIKTETIRQKIRDDFIADATVTIVLVGPETYTRKHVDWEIGSSLRKTKKNSRCGLVGILLPNHPDHGKPRRNVFIPQRLAANLEGKDAYAQLYDWPKGNDLTRIRNWIHKAFLRRDGTPPNNSMQQFKINRRPIDTTVRSSKETERTLITEEVLRPRTRRRRRSSRRELWMGQPPIRQRDLELF